MYGLTDRFMRDASKIIISMGKENTPFPMEGVMKVNGAKIKGEKSIYFREG